MPFALDIELRTSEDLINSSFLDIDLKALYQSMSPTLDEVVIQVKSSVLIATYTISVFIKDGILFFNRSVHQFNAIKSLSLLFS